MCSLEQQEGPTTVQLIPDRAYKRMPPELWDKVIDGLPSLTGRHAADAFGFGLSQQHLKHSAILKHIFYDHEKWTSIVRRMGLNTILVGDDLHLLYDDPMQPAYLALLTGDRTKTIRHNKSKLMAALRPHSLNKYNEIVFIHSKIILNIEEAIHNPFYVTLTPAKLFAYGKDRQLRSASLYLWDNEYAVRTIELQDIVGSAEKISEIRDVSLICGITLSHPKELKLRRRYQQCFQHMDCPTSFPISPAEYKFNGDNMLGWRLEGENLRHEVEPVLSSLRASIKTENTVEG